MRGLALVAVLLMAGCTGAEEGADSGADGNDGSMGTGTSTLPSGGTETETATCGYLSSQPCTCPWVDGCEIPGMDADPDLVFLTDETYPMGGATVVRVRNDGSVGYVYRTSYAACDLEYFTDSGRRFLIPEGTHCDIANTGTIEPGATVDLFAWDLDECVRDQWGCSTEGSRDLGTGTYHIRGTFCAADADADDGFPAGDCERGETRTGTTLRIA